MSLAAKPKLETIPEGAVLHVKLDQALASNQSLAGDAFEATLAEPVQVVGKVVVPEGTPVEGRDTPAATLVVLTLLSLGLPPYSRDAAQNTVHALKNPAHETAEANGETPSKADCAVKDVATDAAPARNNAAHRTPEASAKATHAGTDVRQLQEESGANYYAQVYGVPVELVDAIIDQESGWNPYAVSRKGAAGLMQLMPATATRFGVRNPFRVKDNIRGGVAYLAWLGQKCNGDFRLMTAAYHGGEYQVSLGRQGQSFSETQAYVRRIAQKYCERQVLIASDTASQHRHVGTMPVQEGNKSSATSTNAGSDSASHLWSRMSAQRPCAVDNATDPECLFRYSAAGSGNNEVAGGEHNQSK